MTKNFYYNLGRYNFGDSINEVFFKTLLNDQSLNFKRVHSEEHYMTTGSVLECATNKSIIYGTGFISDKSNTGEREITGEGRSIAKARPLKIISVRGPKTRNKLLQMGIDCPEIYGDPLLLFPIVYNNPDIKEINGKVCVIPHYYDYNTPNVNTLIHNLKRMAREVLLLNIIVPDHNYKKFIDQILECEYVVASSLHAVMLGLIYRKKTIFIQFSDKLVGSLFKFHDFFGSLNINYKVRNDYSINVLNNVINLDYNKLKTLVHTMIDVAPFILNKQELKEKYELFDNQYAI